MKYLSIPISVILFLILIPGPGFALVIHEHECSFITTPEIKDKYVSDNENKSISLFLAGPVMNQNTGLMFTTIQAAIDDAMTMNGNTIMVSAGTYIEDVNVSKQLTFEGANAGIAAGFNPGTRVTESIVNGGFIINAPNVVINGFRIFNGGTYGGFKVGVAVQANDATISNSIIELVTTPMQSDGISTTNVNNLTLLNNTIRDNWRGIYLNPGSGHTLIGNLIDANNGVGVGIGSDGQSNLTLTGNQISNHTLEGWGASTVGANVVAHDNVLISNGISIAHYGGTQIDASCNWWGSSDFLDIQADKSGDVLQIPFRTTSDVTADNCTCPSGNLVTNINSGKIFCSIQAAIDDVGTIAGHTIVVSAGTYEENILVNKELEIYGAGIGNTIIVPALSGPTPPSCPGSDCAGASNVIKLAASNIHLHDFTVDGDNPNLTSGVVVGGADIDARNGIIGDGVNSYANTEINDLEVKNIWLRGIYPQFTTNMNVHDNMVTNVQGGSGSIGIFSWVSSGMVADNMVSLANDAISANHSRGITFSGNYVMNSSSGIHTDNNGSSGGVADVITGNIVSDGGTNSYGIWVFVPYFNVVVSENTITNIDVGLASAGSYTPGVVTTFTDNVVDAENRPSSTGMYATTNIWGYTPGNNTVMFTGNEIKNTSDDAFYLTTDAGYTLDFTANDNSFTNNANGVNSSGAGTLVENFQCNWWGSAASGDVEIAAASSANYTPWLSDGADSNPGMPGFQPGAMTCDGTPVEIATAISSPEVCEMTGSIQVNFNGGTAPYELAWTGGSTMGIMGSPYTITNLAAGNYDITLTDDNGSEDISNATVEYHPVENVTTSMTYATIQSAIDAATDGDEISVCAGTYPEHLVVDKRLTITGAGSGSDPGMNSVIQGSVMNQNVVRIIAGGTDAMNRLELSNFYITTSAVNSGALTGGVAIDVSGSNPVGFITLDNLTIANCPGSTNGISLRGMNAANIPNESITDLRIINSTISGNQRGIFTRNTQLLGLEIDNVTISENRRAGILAEGDGVTASMYQDFVLTNVDLYHNNTLGDTDPGNEEMFLLGFNGDLEIDGMNVTSGLTTPNATPWNVALAINGKYTGGSAPSGAMSFKNINFSDYPGAVHFPRASLGLWTFANLDAGVTIDTANFDATGASRGGLYLASVGGSTDLVVQNSTFGGKSSYVSAIPPVNQVTDIYMLTSTVNINALLSNTFSGAADNFAIEDRIIHKIDVDALGKVDFEANNVYVTPASFLPALTTEPSIGRGVLASAIAGIINVKAGMYPGNVAVNKAVDIRGAGYGTSVLNRTSGDAAESVVSGPANASAFVVSASNISIRGFSMLGNGTGRGVEENTPVTGTIVKDNFISGNTGGLGVSLAAGSTGFDISENDIQNNYAGVYLSAGASSGSVNANIITNHPDGGLDQGTAVVFEGGQSGVSLTKNYLNDNGKGIYGWNFGAFGMNTIENNDLSGNTAFAVQNSNASNLDLGCNWFGTAGTGAIDAMLDGMVSYSTYLLNGTDTDLPSVGFQPANTCAVLTELYVNDNDQTGDLVTTAPGDDSNPGTAAAPFRTLQQALSAAGSGNTIIVDVGDYTETGQVVIDKDLTIQGQGKANTILRPGTNTGGTGDTRGFILVNPSIEFNIKDLAIDGTGKLVWQAIRHQGNGIVDQVGFTQIKYNESTSYQGTAIAAFGTGNVDVTNCMFTEMGRIGVLYFGTGISNSLFKDNMYTGKGAGNWIDYMLDISAGANVQVENNSVSGNLGVAMSDGSTSAGILVSTFFAPGTAANISGNDITGNSTGIFVGFDAMDVSAVFANLNNIAGNTNGLISTNPMVDATGNWWGDASGPSGEGPGTGDAVSTNVDFCGWLIELYEGIPNPTTAGIPDPEPITTIQACSGEEYSFDLDTFFNNSQGDLGQVTYVYDVTVVPDVNVLVPDPRETGAVSSYGLITETITNFGSQPLIVRYTVTPTSAYGCVGPEFVVNVVINLNPQVDIIPNGTVDNLCPSSTRMVSGTVVPGATYSYLWEIIEDPSGTNSSTILPANTQTATFTVGADASSGILKIKFTATNNATGCAGTKILDVTVHAFPMITGDLEVCVDSTLQLSGSGNPAASDPWMSSNENVATVDADGLVTGVATGMVVITYTNENGCTATVEVNVNQGCTPCEDFLNLTAMILGGMHENLFHAAIQLTSDGIITNGEDITFRAGQAVELLPEFEVELGAILTVDIMECIMARYGSPDLKIRLEGKN